VETATPRWPPNLPKKNKMRQNKPKQYKYKKIKQIKLNPTINKNKKKLTKTNRKMT
jgi:hypothetical protein